MLSYLNFLRRKAAHRAANWVNTISSVENTPKNANVLLVTFRHELAETQLYPFHFYAKTLRQDFGVRCTQISIEALQAQARSGERCAPQTQIKRIFFQASFEMPAVEAVQALEFLKQAYPNANIAYMDWFAPLHIRPALYTDPYIDIYIKKQTYADFSQYGTPTAGDTNLSNYYGSRHGLPELAQQFVAPVNFERKLRLGSNFGLSTLMVDMFLGAAPVATGRDIDLHARIAVNGVPWYKAMRQEAKDAVDSLKGLKIASNGRVKRHKFYDELKRSKLCFSPFGYGEVCWRDYEAHATGALLLKPDMSHLRVLPNVFIPNETYVPLNWDLSDFAEKVEIFVKDEKTRSKIVRQAFEMNRDFIRSNSYSAFIAELM
ncbi:hypothetical protein AEP_03471 [Curvibacter sp. AEP1-3]|nr:hypothetical protein AEP_03471 [Curvibacter sp. AEP1-3]